MVNLSITFLYTFLVYYQIFSQQDILDKNLIVQVHKCTWLLRCKEILMVSIYRVRWRVYKTSTTKSDLEQMITCEENTPSFQNYMNKHMQTPAYILRSVIYIHISRYILYNKCEEKKPRKGLRICLINWCWSLKRNLQTVRKVEGGWK